MRTERKHKGAYRGYYKGIRCDSRWELAFLIYHLDKHIPIRRCTEYFEYSKGKKKHRYYPDFFINGYYVEIKGHFKQNLDLKLNSVVQKGFKIRLIQEKGIQKYLNYCYKKYKTTEIQKVYRKKSQIK